MEDLEDKILTLLVHGLILLQAPATDTRRAKNRWEKPAGKTTFSMLRSDYSLSLSHCSSAWGSCEIKYDNERHHHKHLRTILVMPLAEHDSWCREFRGLR